MLPVRVLANQRRTNMTMMTTTMIVTDPPRFFETKTVPNRVSARCWTATAALREVFFSSWDYRLYPFPFKACPTALISEL